LRRAFALCCKEVGNQPVAGIPIRSVYLMLPVKIHGPLIVKTSRKALDTSASASS